MSDRSWNIIGDQGSPLRDVLLRNRSVAPEQEDLFFHPTVSEIPDPFLFRDMDRAVSRVKRALSDGERIIVFGDYDVDGITGTAILVRTLLRLGAHVSYRLPHRVHDGYGLKHHLIEEIASKDVKLIITVDNGISAAKEIDYANSLGMDVIITDHHSVPSALPAAVATLHPKTEDEPYPFRDLCGAGVAFLFSRALLESMNVPNAETFWLEMIDLASLGTVADCVPLVGANRAIVKEGLAQLSHTVFPGLRYLIERADGKQRAIDTETIGFVIGPRLNAAGRMDTAMDSLHLFLSDEERGRVIADKLHRLNGERQVETDNIVGRVASALADDPPESIVVVEGEYHIGIIGIVAARMAEQYGLPAIVMGRKGDELTGSCRSNGIVNMIDTLRQFSRYFSHFGGHEAAAGLSMPREHFASFKRDVSAFVGASYGHPASGPVLGIDAILPAERIDWETCQLVEWFEPFGMGNTKPVFMLSQAVLVSARPVGSAAAHLKMTVRKDGKTFDAIWFRNGSRLDSLPVGSVIDLAFHLEKNAFQGREKVSLNVVDVRL